MKTTANTKFSVSKTIFLLLCIVCSLFAKGQSLHGEIVKLPFYVTDGVLGYEGSFIANPFDGDEIDKFYFDPLEVTFTKAKWRNAQAVSPSLEIAVGGSFSIKNVNSNLRIKSVTWERTTIVDVLSCSSDQGKLEGTNIVTWISPSSEVQEVKIDVSRALTRIKRFVVEYENLAHEIHKLSVDYKDLEIVLSNAPEPNVFQKWDGTDKWGYVQKAKVEDVLINCPSTKGASSINQFGYLTSNGFEVRAENTPEVISLANPKAKMVAISMSDPEDPTYMNEDRHRTFISASEGSLYSVDNNSSACTDWGYIDGINEVELTADPFEDASRGPTWKTLDIYYYLEEEPLEPSESPEIEGSAKFVGSTVVKMNMPTGITDTEIYYTTNGEDPGVKVLSNKVVQVNSAELYNGSGITISETTEFRALAITKDHDVSPVVTAKFEKLEASIAPIINGEEKFERNTIVTISSSDNQATLYYTIDGSDPEVVYLDGNWITPQNTLIYSGEIVLEFTTTVKALSVSSDMGPSPIVEKLFVQMPRANAPILDVSGEQLFSDEAFVNLNGLPEDAITFYTLNGSRPTFTDDDNAPIATGDTRIADREGIIIKESCILTIVVWEPQKLPSEPLILNYKQTTSADTPIIEGDNHFIGSTKVTITSADIENAKIFYTTDGSEPVPTSTDKCYLYSEALILNNTATVKALAIVEGKLPSSIAYRTFTQWEKTPTPEIIGERTFIGSTNVTIEGEPEAAIYYTLDNTDPAFNVSEEGTVTPLQGTFLYSETLPLSLNCVVKAAAVLAGCAPSEVVEAEFVKLERSDTPEISAPETFFEEAVIIMRATPNAKIFYTIDGSDPDVKVINGDFIGDNLYESSVVLTKPTTIKAVACEEGKAVSEIVTKQIRQAQRTPKPVINSPIGFDEKAEIVIEAPEARVFYTIGTDNYPEVKISEDDGIISCSGETQEYTTPIFVQSTSVVRVVAVGIGLRISEVVECLTTKREQTSAPDIRGDNPFVRETEVVMSAPITARILYTLDGSNPEWEIDSNGFAAPKEGSTTLKYNRDGSLKINDRTIVKAIAHEKGKTVSEMVSITFVPADATTTPVISGRNPFAVSSEVTINAEDDTKIFYTTDGSEPELTGSWYVPNPVGNTLEYTAPFVLRTPLVVKAVAWEKSSSISAVAEVDFRQFAKCDTPTISGENLFSKDTEISINCEEGDVEIYYSLDGRSPSAFVDDNGVVTGGPLHYEGPFKISEGAEIRALAVGKQWLPSDIAIANFSKLEKTVEPIIAAPELFGDEAQVRIVIPDGALVRYTLDGSDPDEHSQIYQIAISIDSPVEVRARAWKDGFAKSDVSIMVIHQMERSEPVEISGASPFVHEVVVTLTAAPQAKIYYSTDGVAPVVKVIGADKVEVSENANLYESPFKINSEEHIIAVALEGSKRASEPVERRFERAGVTAKPSISGVTPFLESTVVTITASQGAEIYFTLDGSEPTSSSLHYTEPFTLNYSALVRAIAKLPQSDFSAVAEMRFEKSALTAKPIIEAPALFGDEAHVKIKGEGDIWFTLDGTLPQPGVSDRYVAELLMTEPFTLKAIAQADGKLPSEVAEHIGLQMERTESAVISGNELFEGSAMVSIQADNAQIWYTLDGTLPVVHIIDAGEPQVSEGAMHYTGPFEISSSLTVSAVAISSGKRASLPTQRSFERKDQSLAPSISGTNPFETQTLVTITAKSGAQIYFTLDGTKPEQGSPSTFLYREPLLLTTTTLVRAIAVEEGKAVSPVAETLFEKKSVSRRPEIDVVELFGDEADVTITAAPGARIFFTIDGSMPDASAEEYTEPFVIVSSVVIRAIAIEEGKAPSVMTEKQVVQMERSSSPEFDTEECSDGSFRVSISASAGASVYYSIDQLAQLTLRNQEDLVVGGSTQAYTQPIMVAPGSQIYAMALKSGSRPSEIMTAAMPARDAASAPVIEGDSPFEETTLVSISAEEGLKIFYTTDNLDPVVKRGLDDEPVSGSSSTLEFYVPFEISVSKVIKAVAVGAGKAVSPLAVKEFERVDPTGISDLTSDDSSVKVGKGSITGPADMKVFDAWGRPCKREGLRPGVYIIVIGNKSFKVMVKS